MPWSTVRDTSPQAEERSRKATRYLRAHFADVIRPLARLALQTDAKRVLVQTTDKKHLLDATAGGQVVITVAAAPIVQDLRSRVAELRSPKRINVSVRGDSYIAVLTPELWLDAGGESGSRRRGEARRRPKFDRVHERNECKRRDLNPHTLRCRNLIRLACHRKAARCPETPGFRSRSRRSDTRSGRFGDDSPGGSRRGITLGSASVGPKVPGPRQADQQTSHLPACCFRGYNVRHGRC
jgi:hypothetical protein